MMEDDRKRDNSKLALSHTLRKCSYVDQDRFAELHRNGLAGDVVEVDSVDFESALKVVFCYWVMNLGSHQSSDNR